MLQNAPKLIVLIVLLLLGACGSDQGTALPTAAVVPTQSQGGEQAQLPTSAATMVALTAAPTVATKPTARATASPTPTLAPGTFANPVIDRDFPDPDTLKIGDIYYAYATGNFDAKVSIQAAKSQDLIHWDVLPDAMPTFPAWAEPDHGLVWAPEVTTTGDGKSYIMYFAARVAGTSRQCIGMATSAKPEGPFESAAEQPLICQTDQGGSIDPSSFLDDDGGRYLLWKNDGNCCGGATWLYIQKISEDGRTLEGQPAKLIRNDQSWEGGVIEAPTLWKHDGNYYLFYSANDYASPSYTVGYALADSPLGPYQKAQRPLLSSSIKDAVVGPGGQDIVLDSGGKIWMLYHSWGAGYRGMNIDELTWEGQKPVLKGPNGRRMPQPVP
jgi:arabinan endo-1,5-alpha-L-arabinosidase